MLESKEERHAEGYPPEFRRKVLDLLAAGRSVTEVAADLGISGACIYNWRKQDRTDRGELPGLTSIERAELVAAAGVSTKRPVRHHRGDGR